MKITETENTIIKVTGAKNKNDEPMDVIPPLPCHNFAALFVGTPGSGKTSLLISLLSKYYKRCFDKIYFFTGSIGTIPETFLEKLHPDRVFSDLDNLEEIMEEEKEGDAKLLFVFDDMLKEIDEKQKLLMKLIQNRRHYGSGACIAITTQKITKIPLSLRTGIDTIFFYKGSYNNKRETDALYTDYVQKYDKDEFADILKYIFQDPKEPYMFAFIDLKHDKIYKRFNLLHIT